MLSVNYAGKIAYSAGKTRGGLMGGAQAGIFPANPRTLFAGNLGRGFVSQEISGENHAFLLSHFDKNSCY